LKLSKFHQNQGLFTYHLGTNGSVRHDESLIISVFQKKDDILRIRFIL
jgi:hypothetical protein